MSITIKPEQHALVEQAFEILHQRIAPAKLNRTTSNGTYFSLWLAEQVSELPADAQTLADAIYRCICKHLSEDVLDWAVEPKALAKYKRVDRPPVIAGRNVSDENKSAQERDKQYEEQQRILKAKKENATAYQTAKNTADQFILDGRLGQSIEVRKELHNYISKQFAAGRNGVNVLKEVEKTVADHYREFERRKQKSFSGDVGGIR